MKTLFRHCGVLAISCFACAGIHAQGHIVPNGIVDNLFGGEIDLIWSATTQINGFTFEPVGKSNPNLPYSDIFRFSEPVTIGARVFLIAPNQPFALNNIVSSTYTEISSSTNPSLPANPTIIFGINSPFYVALYSGAQFAEYYPAGNTTPVQYTDPVFGWAELVNNHGAIQLLNGALAYGAAGIFAGTQNIIPIPEPGVLGLVAVGVLVVGRGIKGPAAKRTRA